MVLISNNGFNHTPIILQSYILYNSLKMLWFTSGWCSGGEPRRDESEVHSWDRASSGLAHTAGGWTLSAAPGHATNQNRLRAVTAYQTESGAGDRHLPEAAGWRGRVRTQRGFSKLKYAVFFWHYSSLSIPRQCWRKSLWYMQLVVTCFLFVFQDKRDTLS